MKRIKWTGFALLILLGGLLLTCMGPVEDRPGPQQNMAVAISPGGVMPYPNLCLWKGTVVALPDAQDMCNLNILLDNGELLYPYSFLEPFDLEEGQRLSLGYEQMDIVLENCKGIPVLLTCIGEIPAETPDLCIHLGIVRKLGDCGTVIEAMSDGLLYYPVGLEEEWLDNERVVFGYQRVDAPTPPCEVIPVVVTCIAASKWDRKGISNNE